MPPPDIDPRDAEYIETVVGAVAGLRRAAHDCDRMSFLGHLCILLTTIIEKDSALWAEEGVHDAALRRAVMVLGAGGHHSPPGAE